MRTAKFERIQFAPADSPEGYIQAARHLTPEYIYQPRHIEHANGCIAAVRSHRGHCRPRPFGEKYRRYLAACPVLEAGAIRFRLPLGTTSRSLTHAAPPP